MFFETSPFLFLYTDLTSEEQPIWWCHSDHLGSSSYITDVLGKPCQYLEYLPFGEVMVQQSTNNIFENVYRFNGKELDDSMGYYCYGARYYDPGASVFLSVDPLAESMPKYGGYVYTFNNPINFTDPTGMAPEGRDTDYYNLKGNHVKHVDDGKIDKKMVLSQSGSSSVINQAIDKGEVVSVPSNSVISQMDNAYSDTERTGNEHGFVVATDGTSSTTKEGTSDGVNLRSQYNEILDIGKTSSYDVHTHPNGVDSNGVIIDVGLPIGSGVVGARGNGTKDFGSYGKDGPNDSPSMVLGYNVVRTTTANQLGGNSQTSTKSTKQIGFYNGNGVIGKPGHANLAITES